MKRNFHTGRQLSSGLSLNILTDDELDEIHYGTLEVLNETGVFVEDENALDYFEEGGAVVHRDLKHDNVLAKIRSIVADTEKEMGIEPEK